LINRNPADYVDPPSIEKTETPVLPNREAILALQEAVKGTMLYLPVLLATTGGLRRGEICALRWQDVDFETKRIYVRHSLQRVEGKGLELKTTKNEKGRSVVLPATVMNILKHEYLTRYEGDNKDHGSDFVCAWEDGRPLAPDYITHEFEKLTKKLGLNITFHGLRHSHDTLLFRYKVDPKLVADRSGRDETLTIKLYEHVLPDMQEEVAELLERILYQQQPESE
jgi:integrase